MKKKIFHVDLDYIPNNEIFININKLDKGHYLLNIIHENKIIKRVTFRKK